MDIKALLQTRCGCTREIGISLPARPIIQVPLTSKRIGVLSESFEGGPAMNLPPFEVRIFERMRGEGDYEYVYVERAEE